MIDGTPNRPSEQPIAKDPFRALHYFGTVNEGPNPLFALVAALPQFGIPTTIVPVTDELMHDPSFSAITILGAAKNLDLAYEITGNTHAVFLSSHGQSILSGAIRDPHIVPLRRLAYPQEDPNVRVGKIIELEGWDEQLKLRATYTVINEELEHLKSQMSASGRRAKLKEAIDSGITQTGDEMIDKCLILHFNGLTKLQAGGVTEGLSAEDFSQIAKDVIGRIIASR